jgi:hypothetical protein
MKGAELDRLTKIALQSVGQGNSTQVTSAVEDTEDAAVL